MSNVNCSGADEVVAALRNCGVECVFGVPGSQNLALFDALQRSKLRTILATSEAMAGFMANGWYRASGRPGVFVAMPGPGFAFAIPPLAEAALDSSAILLITGQPACRGRMFDLQSIDQDTIVEALCDEVWKAESIENIHETVTRAVVSATRCGTRPVVLQIARSALEQDVPAKRSKPNVSVSDKFEWSMPKELQSILKQRGKLLIFAGTGALGSSKELLSFAYEHNALIATTPAARGIVPENDSRIIPVDLLVDNVGGLNELIDESDMTIALGCRFSHNGSGGYSMRLPKEKLVHVHANPSVLNSNYEARWTLPVEVGDFMKAAGRVIRDRECEVAGGWAESDAHRWRAKILNREAGKEGEPRWAESESPGCKDVFDKIRESLPDDGILVTDTGNHQILARKYFEVRRPRGLIAPTDFQSMGFGLPAAIGAALAAPECKVVALIGDGSFLMTTPELVTIAREEIPLLIIVFADGWLGQIRMHQVDAGAAEFATRLHPVDIELLAKSVGINYLRGQRDLGTQIEESLKSGLPVIIELGIEDPQNLSARKVRARARRKAKEVLGPLGIKIAKRLLKRAD